VQQRPLHKNLQHYLGLEHEIHVPQSGQSPLSLVQPVTGAALTSALQTAVQEEHGLAKSAFADWTSDPSLSPVRRETEREVSLYL
jgi:hypothetical protein